MMAVALRSNSRGRSRSLYDDAVVLVVVVVVEVVVVVKVVGNNFIVFDFLMC